MKNQEYIVSTAMLAAYLGKNSLDCLDLMKPFVLYLLPDEGSKVEVVEISKRLKTDFGFNNVPDNVVVKILNRINRSGDYVKKEEGSYCVLKNYDKSSFEKNRRQITTKIDDIADKLVIFLKKKYYNIVATKIDAREYIQVFLESYNYIYNEIDKYKTITKSSSDTRSNLWVARFLIDSYENESGIFDDFLEIIKGSLASRAITFWAENNSEYSKKLHNTIFYFDTRLLINCLGIGAEEEQRATTELKELIESNGGKVRTFQNHIEELHGILTKYIKSPSDRAGLSLDYFRKTQLSSEYVRMYRDSIKSHLEHIDILVDEKPDCSIPIKELNWPIDVLEMKRTLGQYVNYSNDDKGKKQLDNDVQTLESISILRYNQKGKPTLEDCKAIFVTQNTDITYAVHNYFLNNKEVSGIGLAVSEVELTAWLWLNYSKNSNELPKLKLLENAYTACCPTDAVVAEFSKIVSAMSEKGMITEEQAQVIRQGNVDLSTLVDKSNNDSDDVYEKDVQDIVNDYLERIERQVRKNFQKEFHKLGKEKKEFQEGQDKQLKQLERREKYIESLEEEQKRKVANYKKTVMQSQIKRADDYAKRDQRIFQIFANSVVVLISAIFIMASIWGCVCSFDAIGAINKKRLIVCAFFALLGLIGGFEFINKIRKGGICLVNILSMKLYEIRYEKYLGENKRYIPE